MCYSAAPSTTNQNATNIKMQYEIVIKDDRWCSCYTCLPRTTPAAAQSARKTAAPGTGTGAPQLDQRLLTNTWPKQCTTISIQANKC